MNNLEKKIFDSIESIVLKLGFELVEVRITDLRKERTITVFIDGDQAIGINDCVMVHKEIDATFDELNPFGEGNYKLNVSSLGLDWNIKTDRDFQKNMGKMLVAKLYRAEDGKKEFTGVLTEFCNDSFTLETNEGKKVFERKLVCKLEKYITF